MVFGPVGLGVVGFGLALQYHDHRHWTGFSRESIATHSRTELRKTHTRSMIITNCAACAAPLAHDAPRCVRCKTRYCNSTCQHDHWRRCPVPLTVRGTQALVSFAPLAFELFCAARQKLAGDKKVWAAGAGQRHVPRCYRP